MKDELKEYMQCIERCEMIENAPMREYTTFRIGGPADLMVQPQSEHALLLAISEAKRLGIPYHIIGNGSNLLVSDEGIEGVVIRINGGLSGVSYAGSVMTALAGTLLSAVANDALSRGYMGLEWAAGIPGSVGGAVAMNAGAYTGEIKDVLRRVRCIVNGEIADIMPQDGDLGYRRSRFSAPDIVVLSAEFELLPDDGKAAGRAAEFSRRRREKQPLAYPSAGSIFKRPEGYFAGPLIEGAGLKGRRIGGAEISALHAGFIINSGGATCADVVALIRLVRDTVKAQSGVTLQPEVKYIGRGSECGL